MYVFVHACSNRNLMISSVAFRRPGERYLDCALGEILEIFPPSQKNCFLSLKISDDLFCPLYPINQRNSSFCSPFTNCTTTKMSIFPPSLHDIYHNFRE